ncbi:MAG: MgtC/SapB family protein [Bacillota bacterium]|nr:MgtC/SapB family protein [Bacillota bacterium]
MLTLHGIYILRLLLACILGGLIGYEREHTHRPAGFRTHILVCVGSALVMITSEFIFNKYLHIASVDPTRLGAQVISGIGFLGAGTIIRDGFNVKGLTTAASLWAVSCVGIAVGSGFYEGAIAATILIYITLIILRRVEKSLMAKNTLKIIYIQSFNIPGQIGLISEVLAKYGVSIKTMEFMNNQEEKNLFLKVSVKYSDTKVRGSVMNDLHNLEGVQKVYEE